MVDGESEIDDANFFFADDGKTDAKNEIHATLDAFFNEKNFDDNSSACRFPARKAWLQEKLNITDFPEVTCQDYDDTLKKLNPKSVTFVFPAAHINSPASMFGHTFLRINSAYKSKLLSYAINYAASVDEDKTNGVEFAIKGLTGGYYGKYSLLPYYDKLKEYRDTEQRDIWEYDLDLSEDEVLKMVRHMWELNGTYSDYYFFTENCSYNMLWLLELARPSIHLREYFNYHVIPLESIYVTKLDEMIIKKTYRPSKRTILLKYEELLGEKYIHMPKRLVKSKIELEDILDDDSIDIQKKMHILEASIEFLEYSFSKNDMKKDDYMDMFHNISKARAELGQGAKLSIKAPPNPIDGHRPVRVSTGLGYEKDSAVGYLGIRPVYHDIQDSNYGFLRGTQIEFLNLLLSYSQNKVRVEEATILSIVSLAQRSEFFDSLSWRMKLGWDKDYTDDETNFIATLGAGFSWGNDLAYIYVMADPLFYVEKKVVSALGNSIGVVIDKHDYMNTNMELTRRWYDSGDREWLAELSQNFRLSQNFQLKLNYNYEERYRLMKKDKEERYRATINYYF